jgi:hypothetical protein
MNNRFSYSIQRDGLSHKNEADLYVNLGNSEVDNNKIQLFSKEN